MPKKDKPQPIEKILHDPEVLTRINAVRERLLGSDRSDHLAEVEMWEKKAKKSLILLSLKGHEGIQMIINKGKEEIKNHYTRLRQRPIDISPEGSMAFANERRFDHAVIDLYTWFINLFGDAEQALKEIEAELEVQENPVEEEYKGDQ